MADELETFDLPLMDPDTNLPVVIKTEPLDDPTETHYILQESPQPKVVYPTPKGPGARAALPNIKTLGAINVLNGLKMIKDIPALAGESTLTGLEEITLDVVNKESGHNKLTAAQWTSNEEIKKEIHQFFSSRDKPITSVDEKRKSLADDISLITTYCPNLHSISLFLFLEDFPGLLRPEETWVWQSLSKLKHLQKLIVICHEWDEVSALFTVVGAHLGQLCLSLDGRGR